MTTPAEAPSVVRDIVEVTATLVSETDVHVSLVASGTQYLAITIAREIVEGWIQKDKMPGEMMQIFVNSHPASEVVRQLIPLLGSITTLDPTKLSELDAFKTSVRELVGKHYQLPA